MGKKAIITVLDEVYSRVEGLADHEFEFIFNKMKFEVEGARYSPLCRAGVWDGKIPFFATDGKIYTRLLDRIEPFITRFGYELDFIDKRKPVKIVNDRIDKDWFVRKEGVANARVLRPYQVDAINACLDNQAGFVLAATGAGKCLHGTTWITYTLDGVERSTSYFSLFENLRSMGAEFELDKPVQTLHVELYFPTPSGDARVVAAVVKEDILYQINLVDITTGVYIQVQCAAGHNFITLNGEVIRADVLKPGTELTGRNGRLEVMSAVNTGQTDTFYDVSIDTAEHTYYDFRGVLHHNTWMVAGLTDILAVNKKRSVVIVPSDDLVQQTVETLKQALLDVGTYSGSAKDVCHDVVVATWQALQNNPVIVSGIGERIAVKAAFMHPQTRLVTPKGIQTLKQIKGGDYITTIDKDGELVDKLVVEKRQRPTTDTKLEIVFTDGSSTIINYSQKVAVNGKWRFTSTLAIGDVIDGAPCAIEVLTVIKSTGPEYSLDIEDKADFILDSGIVVLNEEYMAPDGFQAIIVDEAHGAKAKVVGELINKTGGNIPYRFGFTGTLPKPEIDVMTLLGSLGEVMFTITARELIAMGYLAEVLICPVETNGDASENFPDYASEKSFLSTSEKRLDFIADYVIAKQQVFGNTLVLVNSIKQGKALASKIEGAVFLQGADDTETRQRWYALFESRNDLIVIATFGIASTGISIDRIFHLVMIDAGKSFQRVLQSCGRGLRKSGDKSKVYISDIYSHLKWSKKHAKSRASYYKEAGYPMEKVQKFKL